MPFSNIVAWVRRHVTSGDCIIFRSSEDRLATSVTAWVSTLPNVHLAFDGVDYNADVIVAAIPPQFKGVRDPLFGFFALSLSNARRGTDCRPLLLFQSRRDLTALPRSSLGPYLTPLSCTR